MFCHRSSLDLKKNCIITEHFNAIFFM